MNANQVFLLNLLATWYMVGLIWMVQLVHYNLFDRVGAEQFIQYEKDHQRLITPIVGIPMLVESACTVALLFMAPVGVPRWAAWAGAIMLGLIWVSTAFLQIPYHAKLCQGFDQAAYHGLVVTNWIRTVLWTARGVLLGWFASRMMG